LIDPKPNSHTPIKKNRLAEKHKEEIKALQKPLIPKTTISCKKLHYGLPSLFKKPSQMITKLSVVKHVILSIEWVKIIGRMTQNGNKRRVLGFTKNIVYIPFNQKPLKWIFRSLSHSKYLKGVGS